MSSEITPSLPSSSNETGESSSSGAAPRAPTNNRNDPASFELRRAYEKVTADHWLNVTQEDLIGNDLIQGGSTLIPPGTRNGTTPAKIFWKIFSDELLDHIVEASNANARTQHANKRGRPSTVDKEDIRKLIAMQVDICAYGYDNFTEYLRSPNENIGLSQREYERVRHVLDFNTEEFFNLFNVALKTLVNAMGPSAIDEATWEFFGSSAFKTFIDRKPHSTGFKVIVWCFKLMNNERPVLWHLIPDIRIPCLTANGSLERMMQHAPSNPFTLTVDSWFSSLGWTESHLAIPCTFAIAKAKLEEEVKIFC